MQHCRPRPCPRHPARLVAWLLPLLFPLLVAASLSPAALAQDPPRRELPQPMEFLGSQDDNLFTVSRSQEDIHEYEQALEQLQKGEHAAAVERLHQLLRNEMGGIVPVAPARFLGLRLAVITTMANLPPAAAAAYETLVRREAGNLAAIPLLELDADQLAQLANRFPTAELGRRARLRLGDLSLEAGQAIAAAAQYRAALDATAIGSDDERRLTERLAATEAIREPRTARAAAAAQRLPPAAALALQAMPPAADPTCYPAFGGGGDGRLPMAMPAGRPVAGATEDVLAPGFGIDGGTFAMHAVGDLDGIYLSTGLEVLAFDPLRRTLAWGSPSPLRDEPGDRSDEARVNQDHALACAVGGDVVVAALQVPDNGVNVDFNQGLRIINKLPVRRLFAFHRTTGKLVWSHFDGLDGSRTRRFRGHDACGPPLVVGDTVYAPIHDRSGAIAFSVGAYDLRTGALRWRRLICSSQQEVNMFGNARAEFAASPLAHADGLLFGASNLGVAYAIELATGRLRWITAYDVVSMPMTRFHGQQTRPVYFANNPPAICAGTVCMLPLDSPYALGLSVENGTRLWRLPASAPVDGTENDVRWLCGVLDDEFVLSGRGAVAVAARAPGLAAEGPTVRQLVRPDQLRERGEPQLLGRPALTADHLWFPRPGRISAFDRAGNPIAEQTLTTGRVMPGNLLFVDGIVVALRQRAFDVLVDEAALVDRIERRLQATPDEPALLLRLAGLRGAMLAADAAAADRQAVTDLYRRGLDACLRQGLPKTHPTRQALQRELHEQAMAAALAALDRDDPTAADRLLEARDSAPELRAWLRVQVLLLERIAGEPSRVRRELELLQREAPASDLELTDGSTVPVAAYVLWRQARLPDLAPAAAVAAWQALLEQAPDANFGGVVATTLAEAAIARLVDQHGADAYQAIARRADAALQAAGAEPEALRALCRRFPNSQAAGAARRRLLDRAVADGDLAATCDVLATAQRTGNPAPGILRRVMVAAAAKGNRPLADAFAQRLLHHGEEISDWPADQGATYRAVVEAHVRTRPAVVAPTPMQVPSHELARIRSRPPRETYSLRQVVLAEGFPAPADTPLYAVVRDRLVAIDVHAAGPEKPVLFRRPFHYLEHLVLCGTTLLVPDLESLCAIDYRTGNLLWELTGLDGRLVDGLGVQQGVLHVSAQSEAPDSGAELLGIEPLSGAVLFRLVLPADRIKPVPKPTAGDLLVVQTGTGDTARILRLDPLDGSQRATVPLDPKVLQRKADLNTDGLTARLFPQSLCGDRERIYLPIDSTASGDAPRLLALDDRGQVLWTWQGLTGTHLAMAALRGDRLVVVESGEDGPGRLTLLQAVDGAILRSTPVGAQLDILNWQRTYLRNPAPAALLLSDQEDPSSRNRRLWCFGVDADAPSFLEPLGTGDDVQRTPWLADGLLVFGIRPAQRGPFTLHVRNLTDRSGALPDGAKSQRLQIGQPMGITVVGPYTVIAASDGLVVLGAKEGK